MGKWTTQNPPKKTGRYLITLDTSFGKQVRQADRGEYPKGNWFWCVMPFGNTCNKEVIAWQKCPEPYEGK